MVAAMVAGTALVIGAVHRPEAHRAPRPATRKPVETPWLSPAATAQIVGGEGKMGPLFDQLVLGGAAPSADVRKKIADFARANHVDIDLEVSDGDLAAVRFGVTYGGCCGYEGADVLALRLGRPRTGGCGVPVEWYDDWSSTTDGIHMHARVDINRVEVRWEPALAVDDVLEQADRVFGEEVGKVALAAGDHWVRIDAGHYRLQVPYGHGIDIRAEHGRITRVVVALRDADGVELEKALRARWGRPRSGPEIWTWRAADRLVTAELGNQELTISEL